MDPGGGDHGRSVRSWRLKTWLIIAFGVLLAVAGYFAYQAWRIEAVFNSEPPGAVVRVDGRGIGLTPLVTALDPGRHRIRFEHSHYQAAIVDLTVSRGDRVQETVTLLAGMGRLSLLSNPIGAWVELDGVRQAGVTPMEVLTTSGPVDIRMGLTERRVAEQQVIVLADDTISANLSLDMDPHGSLVVAVSPADARIRFPELDRDYEKGMRLPIGEQLLEVTRPGYETQRIRFDVQYGDNRTRVALRRASGALEVRVTPADAQVTLAYPKESGAAGQERVIYKPGMKAPVGPLEVSARALGYRTALKSVDLTSAGARVVLELDRIQVTAGEIFADELASGGAGPEMIVIPAGSFLMGDPEGPPSMQPATTRTLSQPFAVAINEISVAEYRQFAAATGADMDERLVEEEEPVRYVAWEEAVAYTDWLTRETGSKYRLLTEAEWEYVARAGTDTEYWFGDDLEKLCEFANLADESTRRVYRDWAVLDCDDGFGRLAPVGSFPANPFGLHDVHGNVSEWVLECGMPEYRYAEEDGTVMMKGQSCSTHGVRGGSWDSQPEALRSRRRGYARHRGDDRGFRVLKEL